MTRITPSTRVAALALVASLALAGIPAAAGAVEGSATTASGAASQVTGVSDVAAAPASLATSTAAVTATTTSAEAEVVEIDLVGVDPAAEAELEAVDQQAAPAPADVEPDTSPGLVVESPLSVLPDEAEPAVVTEKMSAAPFSVLGVTWDLDPAVGDVVVQYRTFREGAWTDWGWVPATEEYVETATGAATRGATDPVFVPDSTGVQVIVSSTGIPVTGTKVVLIDPGAGPEGNGASVSSGEPTDAATDAPAPDPVAPAAPTDPAAPGPVDPTDGAGTSTPPADPSVTPGPTAPVDPEPTAPTTEPGSTPTPAPTSDPTAPTTPTTPEAPAESPDPGVPTGPSTTTGSGAATTGATPTVSLTSGSLESTGARAALAASLSPLTQTAPLAVPQAGLATATLGMPRIVSRAAWGAGAPACALDYSSATLAAAVHHTASTNSYTADQVPGLLRGFAAYHMRPEAQGGRGWCDIGYNFLVDKFGTIYEGRAGGIDLPAIGVHTGGFNSRTFGVSAIGNYQEAVPTAAMAEAISQIIAWKFAQYRILANTNVNLTSGGGASKFPAGTVVAFSTIFGHRDAQLTSCPGQYLYNLLPDIRNRVAVLSNAVVSESPQGAWDVASSGHAGFRVAGWARDPSDTGRTVTVQVIVDGVATTTIPAHQNRSDVGAHGFDTKVAAPLGRHTVCLRYLNIGGGGDVLLGCRSLTVLAANPVGSLDAVNASATGVYVAGWARDPETTSPIDVHVYANALGTAWTANQPRADVQAAAPGEAGPRHGFSGTIPLAAGQYSVCAYGINVGSGSNTLLGCRTVTVGAVVTPPVPPRSVHDARGSLDVVRSLDQTRIQVAGWALDPDTSASIQVHIYVDGRAVSATTASGHRPDVAALFGKGAAHGFDRTLTVGAGRHEVCVYALDSNGGRNALLGCRGVGAENQAPIGSLDVVRATSSSTVQVAGWALDPDTTASIQVHVYVDGLAVQATTASGNRPDVAALHRKGAAHGFDTSVTVSEGTHSVCVYALDSIGGRAPQLGCRTVTVVNQAPIGSLDLVRAAGGSSVQVAGWALDPDTSRSVQVHLYVDGRAVQALTAAGHRPDVASAYGRGAAHGFDVRAQAAPGQREVCAYALDTAGGRNSLLGCQVVTVS